MIKSCELGNSFILFWVGHAIFNIFRKNVKSLKTQLLFKIILWATVNEKGVVFRMWCSGRAIQEGKENNKFTFISKEINTWNTFWNVSKLAIVCSETLFCKNSYYQELVKKSYKAKQLASFKMIHIFKEMSVSKQTLSHFQPMCQSWTN